MKEYITEFKDYRDLPFSRQIQDELLKKHTHVELLDNNKEAVVYEEKDVLILLQMVKEMDELVQAKKEMDLIWAIHKENKTCTILESKKAHNIGLEYGSRGNVIYSIVEKYYNR